MKELRNPFDKYCMSLLDMKDFNALINNELFLDQAIKIKKKCMENLSKCWERIIIQQETY